MRGAKNSSASEQLKHPISGLWNSRGGGGGHDLSSLPDFFCYAFERLNTSKMTQTEMTRFFFYIYHILND